MKTMMVKTVAIGGLLLLSSTAHALTWSDTFIGYRYGSQFSEPGNSDDVEKNILQLGHVSGYRYGQNFFNLDVLHSGDEDPAKSSDDGATEAYLVYRHQLHYGKLFDEPLAFGPVKDVALTAGFDLNTKNSEFAPQKRFLAVGPTLKFDLPAGFLDVSLYYAREWNHCGLDACGLGDNENDISFDAFYQFNAAWGIPFDAYNVPLKFQGFFNYNAPKGEDYFGRETKPERLIRSSLMMDIGDMVWGDSNQLWVGAGYEFWRNKYGNHDVPGSDTDAVSFNLEWHL
ncbi:MAG: hypothetical protein CME82_08245 [Halomonas sp.]|nr:hypothetical protein [Halomonas sp.]|tara:strand:- start:8144 stop:8998 length:855 start_codon:yes stop_codon:yes gene_type:complete